MIVSVDFDGTITRSSDPQSAGFNCIRPGCKETLLSLNKMGVKFLLLTGRRPEWTPEAVELCKKWKLPIDVEHPNTKRISDVYIDDRNIGCTGIDWDMLRRQLYSMLLEKKSGSHHKEKE